MGMMVRVTDREGVKHELSFQEGDTLMEVLTEEDLGVRAECGGCCSCATCHVYVAPAWVERLQPQIDHEVAKIGRAHVLTPVTNSHLVCRLLLEKKNNKCKMKHTKSSLTYI